jgi:phospholipid transport system substrate-binding protein
MISLRRSIFGPLFLIAATAGAPLIAFAPSTAFAQAQDTDPGKFVQDLGNKAIAQLAGKSIPEQEEQARFRQLLNDYFDLKAIGKFTVGRALWSAASPQQQEDFLALYTTQVTNAYAKRFEDYSGEQFKVTGQTKEEEDSVVNSEISRANGGPPIPVQWRVRPENGGLKIVDVIIAGISMATTDRQQFSAVIQRGGGSFDALIQALKTQNVQVAQPKG